MNEIPKIFDRKLIAQRLTNALKTEPDFITQIIWDDLSERLKTISRPFDKAILLAPQTSQLPSNLASALGPIKPKIAQTMGDNPNQIDPENLHLPADDYNLIISLFDMAITNDVPGFLQKIAAHLAPDGLFIAAFVGGTSLSQLRAAWLEADATHLGGAVARIAPFIDIKDAGSLMQRAGFALPVIDKETLNLRYASPMHLMAEIKNLAATNPLFSKPPKPVTKAHLASAVQSYNDLAKDPDERIRATLEIIWVSGWGPDEIQQKPLKPGSAKISLTKVLGNKGKLDF